MGCSAKAVPVCYPLAFDSVFEENIKVKQTAILPDSGKRKGLAA